MRKWLPLVAICTGTFMLLIDVTIVNVALPDMALDLGTSFDQLQWVVDVYALALSALVLGAGSLADLYGRRKVYLAGLLLFAIASLACGLAPGAELLIVARAVQGIGGAAMLATTIALINTSYEGRDRGTALGVWGAVVGAAAGAVVGAAAAGAAVGLAAAAGAVVGAAAAGAAVGAAAGAGAEQAAARAAVPPKTERRRNCRRLAIRSV